MFSVKFKHIFTAFAVTCVFVGTAEAGTRIECPLTKARRTITDPLPDGWWTTPFVSSLSGVAVRPIGGEQALICEYGVSGSVQRRVPADMTCLESGSGFSCESAAASSEPSPRTLHTGLLVVPQTYTVDFDTGTVGTGPGKPDIWFEAETSTLLYITPRNGARMSIHSTSQGLAGCKAARSLSGRVSLNDIGVGTYICVQTDEGRTAQFRINAISGGSPKDLDIGYATWAN